MKYIIEPALLALDENTSERDFKIYVNRLLQWDKWIDAHPDDVYVLSDTEDWLYANNVFPIYTVFESLMSRYNIDYVQADNLNQMINRLVRKAQKLDRLGTTKVDDEYVFGELNVKGNDDGSVIVADPVRKKVMWNLFCRRKADSEFAGGCIVFTKDTSGVMDMSIAYQTLDDSEEDFVDYRDEVSVRCHDSLKDFFSDGDSPMAILRQVERKEDLELALRMAVYQRGGLKKVMDAFENYQFVLQNSFFKDYRDAHYCDNSTIMNRLMEEMSNVLLNRRLDNREDFRTGIGGNNPQLKSPDKLFLAWRWFVTRSVKMMYWQRDCMYKFANVKEHDIFVCEWES